MAADFSWTPPLVVLAVGAVAGAVLVASRARRSAARRVSADAPSPEAARLADLRRRYDALIRRLSEGAPEPERSALELEAAQVLREMDGGAPAAVTSSPASAEPQPGAAAPSRAASPLAGFAYGVITTAAIGGLIFYASQGATVRPEGGSPTGGNTMGSAAAAGSQGVNPAEVAALEEAVRKAPRNVPQRIELTRAYLQQRDLMKVFEQTQAVLEIEPGNPQGLTYEALVRIAMGQSEQAEAMLVEAIKKDPTIEDAYIHLALARVQRGDHQGAEAAIQAGQRQFPEDKDQLASVFAQITSAADEKPAPGGGNGPPAMAPSAASGSASTTSASSPEMVVVVDLPRGVVVPPSALLFVIVREAGFESGPPIAVKRVPAANFPITVTISDRDSMSGESLPGLVRLDARVDRDGDPMTKDPRDPVASEDNVRPGGGQILLVLVPGQA